LADVNSLWEDPNVSCPGVHPEEQNSCGIAIDLQQLSFTQLGSSTLEEIYTVVNKTPPSPESPTCG